MDWKQIIGNIQRHGNLTQAQIAQLAQCGQATISDLSKGATKQPSYALGCALLAILDGVTKEEQKEHFTPTHSAQAATQTIATQGA